jgi:hypothetical protein
VLEVPFIGQHGELRGGRRRVVGGGGDSMKSLVSWSKKGRGVDGALSYRGGREGGRAALRFGYSPTV